MNEIKSWPSLYNKSVKKNMSIMVSSSVKYRIRLQGAQLSHLKKLL